MTDAAFSDDGGETLQSGLDVGAFLNADAASVGWVPLITADSASAVIVAIPATEHQQGSFSLDQVIAATFRMATYDESVRLTAIVAELASFAALILRTDPAELETRANVPGTEGLDADTLPWTMELDPAANLSGAIIDIERDEGECDHISMRTLKRVEHQLYAFNSGKRFKYSD